MFLQRWWISASQGLRIHCMLFFVQLRCFIQFLKQLGRKCVSNSHFLHISCLHQTTQVYILPWIFLPRVHVHKRPCCGQSHMSVCPSWKFVFRAGLYTWWCKVLHMKTHLRLSLTAVIEKGPFDDKKARASDDSETCVSLHHLSVCAPSWRVRHIESIPN